jgi:hypothetical protein
MIAGEVSTDLMPAADGVNGKMMIFEKIDDRRARFRVVLDKEDIVRGADGCPALSRIRGKPEWTEGFSATFSAGPGSLRGANMFHLRSKRPMRFS